MANIYLWFATREERRDFTQQLIEFHPKKEGRLNGKKENRHIRETRKRYLNGLELKKKNDYSNLDMQFFFGRVPEVDPKKYRYSPYNPREVFLNGFRKIYYQKSYKHRPGNWLVIQLRSTKKAGEIEQFIEKAIPKERRGTNVPIPEEVITKLKVKRAKKYLKHYEKGHINKAQLLEIAYKHLREVMLEAPHLLENEAYLWRKMAFAFYHEDQLDKMETCLRQQARIIPENRLYEPYLNLGYLYSEKGWNQKAIQTYREGLKACPENAFLLHNLAYLLLEIGDKKGAYACADKAIADKPTWEYNYLLQGDLHFHKGNYAKTLFWYEKALNRSQYSPSVKIPAEHYCRLIHVYKVLGDHARARKTYKRAFQLYPQELPSLNEVYFLDDEEGEAGKREIVTRYSLGDVKIYEGEIKDGEFDGWGKLYNPNYGEGVVVYEGQFQQGKKCGFGREYNRHGTLCYEGEWHQDTKHGLGRLYDQKGNLIYEGNIRNGKKVDIWNAYLRNNRKLVPLKQAPDGYIELYYENKQPMYKGSVKNNRYHGKGTRYYHNGVMEFDGHWYDGLPHGYGVEYYQGGELKYEGEWKHGYKTGKGTGYWPNGNVWYQGEFVNDWPQGYGWIYYKSGALKYEGNFKEGEFIHYGKEYYENGQLKFEGIFKRGPYFWYGARYYKSGKLYEEEGSLLKEGDF